MPDSQFQMPTPPRFNTTSLPTEVVDATVQQPQHSAQSNRETGKTKSTPQPKPQRAIPLKFEVVHGKILGVDVFAMSLGLAIAQGVLAKMQAETGLPTWEIYWFSLAVIVLGGLATTSKTGSNSGFLLMLKIAISAAMAPGLTALLALVFGA
jgi:hypothetical protein